MLIRRFSVPICSFCSTRSNVKKAALIHAIFSCKFSKIKPLYNIAVGVNQFKWFSNFIFSSSIFIGAIFHVIFLRSNKKMIGVNARRIIAFMANIQFFIKFAISKLIRKAMSQFSFAAFFASAPKNAISINIFMANPKPTIISLLHFIPKSFFKRFTFHNLKCSWQFSNFQANNRAAICQF